MAFDPEEYLKQAQTPVVTAPAVDTSGFDPDSYVQDSAKTLASDEAFNPVAAGAAADTAGDYGAKDLAFHAFKEQYHNPPPFSVEKATKATGNAFSSIWGAVKGAGKLAENAKTLAQDYVGDAASAVKNAVTGQSDLSTYLKNDDEEKAAASEIIPAVTNAAKGVAIDLPYAIGRNALDLKNWATGTKLTDDELRARFDRMTALHAASSNLVNTGGIEGVTEGPSERAQASLPLTGNETPEQKASILSGRQTIEQEVGSDINDQTGAASFAMIPNVAVNNPVTRAAAGAALRTVGAAAEAGGGLASHASGAGALYGLFKHSPATVAGSLATRAIAPAGRLATEAGNAMFTGEAITGNAARQLAGKAMQAGATGGVLGTAFAAGADSPEQAVGDIVGGVATAPLFMGDNFDAGQSRGEAMTGRAKAADAAATHAEKFGALQQYGEQLPRSVPGHAEGMAMLPKAEQDRINLMQGFLAGQKNAAGGQIEVSVLPESQYNSLPGSQEGTRGFVSGDGNIYLNAGLADQQGGVNRTAGHELGHVSERLSEIIGGEVQETLRGAIGSKLYGADNQPIPAFQKFIDEYQRQLGGTINRQQAESEFLAETTAKILQGKGIEDFTQKPGLGEVIRQGASDGLKALGLAPKAKDGIFSWQEIPKITGSIRDVLRTVGKGAIDRAKSGLSQQPPPAVTPPDGTPQGTPAAPAPVVPVVAPSVDRATVSAALQKLFRVSKAQGDQMAAAAQGSTVEEMIANAAQAKSGAVAKANATASAGQLSGMSETPAGQPSIQSKVEPTAQLAEVPQTATAVAPKPTIRVSRNSEGAYEYRDANGNLLPSGANGPALTGGQLSDFGNRTSEGTQEAPNFERNRPATPSEGQNRPMVPPEEISRRISDAETKARAEQAVKTRKTPASREKATAQAVKEARIQAILDAAHESAPDEAHLQRREEYGQTKYTGRLDESIPAHKALLDELGVSKGARDNIDTLQDNLGKVVFVDYKSAAKEGNNEATQALGEVDRTGKQRTKEYSAEPVNARIEDAKAGDKNVGVEHTKAFYPMGFRVNPKEGSVTATGFSPNRLLANAGKIIDFLRSEKRDTGYTGANDPEIIRDMQGYAQNHANGYKGDGSGLLAGETPTPNYDPHIIGSTKFDLLNAAMANESAKTPKINREGAKARAADLQQTARDNGGFLTDEGETNPLRDYINKSGRFTFKNEAGETRTGTKEILEPTIENLRVDPELMRKVSTEAPEHEASLRPSGVADPSEMAASGIPKAKPTAAGFMPGKENGDLSSFMPRDEDYDVAEDFMERRDKAAQRLLNALQDSKEGERFAWPTVRAARIKKIWLDFGKSGVVRDEKGMQAITDRLLDNIAMLKASTELMGHSESQPSDVAEEAGFELTPEMDERMTDYFVHSDGSWLLSDYGLPKLEKLYSELFNAETPEQQLYAADRVLNIIHPRSDLASLFIEGGKKTLTEIASQGGYETPDEVVRKDMGWRESNFMPGNKSGQLSDFGGDSRENKESGHEHKMDSPLFQDRIQKAVKATTKLWKSAVAKKEEFTSSDAFKKFFGNSYLRESDTGEPALIYHGTPVKSSKIDAFRIGDLGIHATGDPYAAIDATTMMKGVTKDTHAIPLYGRMEKPLRVEDAGAFSDPRNLLDVLSEARDERTGKYAFSRKQLDAISAKVGDGINKLDTATGSEEEAISAPLIKQLKEFIQSKGYDGLIYNNDVEGGGDSYLFFDSSQLKHASQNNGEFNSSDPRIRFMPGNKSGQLSDFGGEKDEPSIKSKVHSEADDLIQTLSAQTAGVLDRVKSASPMDSSWMQPAFHFNTLASRAVMELQRALPDNPKISKGFDLWRDAMSDVAASLPEIDPKKSAKTGRMEDPYTGVKTAFPDGTAMDLSEAVKKAHNIAIGLLEKGNQKGRLPGIHRDYLNMLENVQQIDPSAVSEDSIRDLTESTYGTRKTNAEALSDYQDELEGGNMLGENEKTEGKGVTQYKANGDTQFMPGQGKEGQLSDFDKPPVDELGFYSGLRKTVMDKIPNRSSAEQIKATLDPAKGGAKKEELEVLGLPQFLEGKKNVTKQELLDFIDANGVKMKEVTKRAGFTDEEKDRFNELVNERAQEVHDKRTDDEIENRIDRGQDEDEIDRTDVSNFLDWDKSWDIARDEVAKEHGYDTENEGDQTKFSQYTLPGGSNYKEVLWTLPTQTNKPPDYLRAEYAGGGEYDIIDGSLGDAKRGTVRAKSPEEAVGQWWDKSTAKQINSHQTDFRYSHWAEPNVLAHLRTADHTDTEGNKVRLIEELQSDWHKKGRKEGYKTQLSPDETADWKAIEARAKNWREADPATRGEFPLSKSEQEKRAEYVRRNDEANSIIHPGVPDAPFKKTWHEVAFKRALKMAVDDGMDKIAWTPGPEQAERYDLSKQVKSVSWNPYERHGSTKQIAIEPIAGNTIELPIDATGRVIKGPGTQFDGKPIDEVLGKDLAEKIMGEDRGDLSGEGLKVGGKGMTGFYGDPESNKLGIVGNFAQKYVKPWGGRVETTTIGGDHDAAQNTEREYSPGAVNTIFDRRGEVYFVNDHGQEELIRNSSELNEYVEEHGEPRGYILGDTGGAHTAHSITITPAMREAIGKGQPMFMPGRNRGRDVMGELDKEGVFDEGDEEIPKSTHAYFAIGHDSEGGQNWIYDPNSRSIKSKEGGTHGMNFGHDVADRSFKGWYDPERDVVSVAFPERERSKLDHEPTVDDIPTGVYNKLRSKFGDDAEMVAFMPGKSKNASEGQLGDFRETEDEPSILSKVLKTPAQQKFDEQIKDPDFVAKITQKEGEPIILADDEIIANSPAMKAAKPEEGQAIYLALQPAAQQARLDAFNHLLAQPHEPDSAVALTAGAPASGKSTIAKRIPGVDFVYDSPMSSIGPARERIQAVLDSGRTAHVVLAIRDPAEAMRANLARGMEEKRVAGVDYSAKAQAGSRETVKQLAKEYAGDPRVKFEAYEVKSGQDAKKITLDDIPSLDVDETKKTLHDTLNGIENETDPAWTHGPIASHFIESARGGSNEHGNLAGQRGREGSGTAQDSAASAPDELAQGSEQGQLGGFGVESEPSIESKVAAGAFMPGKKGVYKSPELSKNADHTEITRWNTANEIKAKLLKHGMLDQSTLDDLDGEIPANYRKVDIESALNRAGDKRDYDEIFDAQKQLLEDDPNHRVQFKQGDKLNIFDWALQNHGETDDISLAGYVLPDGKLLDFSESRNGGGGSRSADHRQIGYPGREGEGYKAMRDFMEAGAVRIDANSGAVDIATKPTREQKGKIRRILEDADGGVIDLTDGKRRVSFEVTGDAVGKVMGRIRRFYDGEDMDGGQLFMPGGEDSAPQRTWFMRGGRRVYHHRGEAGQFTEKPTLANFSARATPSKQEDDAKAQLSTFQ